MCKKTARVSGNPRDISVRSESRPYAYAPAMTAASAAGCRSGRQAQYPAAAPLCRLLVPSPACLAQRRDRSGRRAAWQSLRQTGMNILRAVSYHCTACGLKNVTSPVLTSYIAPTRSISPLSIICRSTTLRSRSVFIVRRTFISLTA